MVTLKELRAEIDQLDSQLLVVLSQRLKLVEKVGLFKHQHQLPTFQPARWQAVLDSRKKQGLQLGLDPTLVENIFNSIHQAALIIEEDVIHEQHGKNHL